MMLIDTCHHTIISCSPLHVHTHAAYHKMPSQITVKHFLDVEVGCLCTITTVYIVRRYTGLEENLQRKSVSV